MKILMQSSCMILKISSEESSSWFSEQLRLAKDITFGLYRQKLHGDLNCSLNVDTITPNLSTPNLAR